MHGFKSHLLRQAELCWTSRGSTQFFILGGNFNATCASRAAAMRVQHKTEAKASVLCCFDFVNSLQKRKTWFRDPARLAKSVCEIANCPKSSLSLSPARLAKSVCEKSLCRYLSAGGWRGTSSARKEAQLYISVTGFYVAQPTLNLTSIKSCRILQEKN